MRPTQLCTGMMPPGRIQNEIADRSRAMESEDDDKIRAASPFSPAPEQSQWRMVATLAIVLAVLLGGWYWQQRGAPKDAPRREVPPRTTSGAAAAASAPLGPASTLAAPSPIAPAHGRTVSKCVLKGKTTYSDGPCPDGAQAVQLAVRADVNLMQAPAIAPTVPVYASTAQPANAPVIVQAPPTVDTGLDCGELERRIKELDAWARQPQTAQMQDLITARKREARDRQFRLKC